MTDISKFSLGKDGKLGEIDFSKIKSGLKGSDLIKNNEQLKSVFNRIDKNGDGKLDREELNALQKLIAELSGDDNLSIKEAKKLEDENGKLGRGGAKLLMELLNKMSEAAKAQGIKNVETRTGGGIEVVTYEDGHTEEIFEDGSVITTVKNGAKTTKTHRDKDGNLLEETVTEDGVETKTTYADGKKVKEVQTKENSVETVNYDSEGNPKDKTVTDKESGVVDSYKYENGEFVLKKRVDSKNNSETVYDGARETTTQISEDTKTVTVKEDGELVRTTSSRKNENNETERTDTTYNGDDYTENFYIDDTIRRQKKVIDGNEYEVNYDSDGNTEGVVVQNGESIALIAKRFGCSVADLIKANASKVHGKHPKVYFLVGEEIKIPRQMEAEDYVKIQAGRKSKAEAVGAYKEYIARIEEEKRIKAEQEAAEAQRKADEVAAQKEQEQKKEARAVAKELHDAIDQEHFAIGQSRFKNALRRVNKDNIVDVLKAYKEISTDLSLVKFIGQECSAATIRRDAIEYLANTLYQKGVEVGVNKEELDKLLAEFKAEAKYQYITKVVGKVDSTKLETILDAMLGSVIAKMTETEEISDEEAIAKTAEMAQVDSKQAKKSFDTAREGERWIAKSSDWVCGLFGCKTIGEMREKVGKHADEIEKLANAKDEVEFKKIFKEVFGVEFDKQKIAAYNTAVENYEQACLSKSFVEAVDGLIMNSKVLSAGEFRELVKEKFGYTDEQIYQFIAAVGSDSGDLKETLVNAITALKNDYQNIYDTLTKGSSLEDMAQDVELIKKGVFGTKDIVKEVDIFNNNMQLTEAIGTGALEIIGTVALSVIPGGAALAAGRVAAMGARFTRLAKVAIKTEKALKTFNNIRKGSKLIGTGIDAVNAGVATGAILKLDGRSMKEIKEHVKTNMAFAGAGSFVGKMAPKIAAAFKISNKVATEAIEDAMDLFMSCVTSKGLGLEYGKTDAGVDMFMNFLMARLAHVQVGGKSAKAGNIPNKPNVAGELPAHQSTTKTLDKATSNNAAHASEVKVGAKKAADIKNEVEEMLKNANISPEELARVRHEVGAIQDREMRRDLLRKIDEAVSKLDPSARATFDAAKKANNKADVDHIFERHNELKNSDMRVLNEYIKSTDDVEALKELKTKLQTKEHEFGGVTQNYKTLYESIDNRIKSLEVKAHHAAEKKAGEAPDAAEAPKAEKKADTPNAEEAPKAEKKADPNTQLNVAVSNSYASQNQAQIGRLEKGTAYEIQGNTKLGLADTIEIDLNDPSIKSRINNLPEGGQLTIGREGDIKINDPYAMVSRIHAIIEKRNGKIYIIDNSTNGTRFINNSNAQVNNANVKSPKDAHNPEVYKHMNKTSDIECTPKQRVKINKNSHIRLGKSVDIDVQDLEYKFKTMNDGDSFIIGRTANGPNDICINNDAVSRQHLRVEKFNGEIYITDLSSTNGTVLNTTSPDFAAKWQPGMRNKYRNKVAEDFDSLCNKYYRDLREGNYSFEESINSNIKEGDLTFTENMFADGDFRLDGWWWHMPKKLNRNHNFDVVDRISLNVKADKRLLTELDKLMQTGCYTNKAGKEVKVDVPRGEYKTSQDFEDWATRHDPITMYFEKNISKELEQAIAEITEKYARKSSNGKALMNSVEGKPWIAHEEYIPAKKAEALYNEALKLNPELAKGISGWVGFNKGWNTSTGGYAAAKKVVDEYKLSLI